MDYHSLDMPHRRSMRPASAAFCLAFIAIATAVQGSNGYQSPAPSAAAPACAASGTAYTRTTLYFGLARPAGTISAKEWKAFVREEVTPRFPQGFTTWEALGQWQSETGRITRERSKVLLLVHPDTAPVRESIAALIATYKKRFQQESVLWETAGVCAAF